MRVALAAVCMLAVPATLFPQIELTQVAPRRELTMRGTRLLEQAGKPTNRRR